MGVDGCHSSHGVHRSLAATTTQSSFSRTIRSHATHIHAVVSLARRLFLPPSFPLSLYLSVRLSVCLSVSASLMITSGVATHTPTQPPAEPAARSPRIVACCGIDVLCGCSAARRCAVLHRIIVLPDPTPRPHHTRPLALSSVPSATMVSGRPSGVQALQLRDTSTSSSLCVERGASSLCEQQPTTNCNRLTDRLSCEEGTHPWFNKHLSV